MNRLHTFTRWPNDLDERLELAEVDVHFADVMTKIMGPSEELRKMASIAFRIKCDVKDELLRMRERKPK